MEPEESGVKQDVPEHKDVPERTTMCWMERSLVAFAGVSEGLFRCPYCFGIVFRADIPEHAIWHQALDDTLDAIHPGIKIERRYFALPG